MIRRAVLRDEEALMSLCRSIHEDDYTLEFLHRWLCRNEVYVYERETIVGMIRLIYSRDGKAHLGAVRVHPESRGEGIGTALTRHCISVCGTDTVRLSIMDNPPSRALAEKIGFSRVATFTLLMKQEGTNTATPSESEPVAPGTILSSLNNSLQFNTNHGLLSSCFTFYHPSETILKELQLIAHGDNMAILDHNIDEAISRDVQIAYCDPDPSLLEVILWEAARCACDEIWAIIYKDPVLISLLEDYGFEKEEWAETIDVYELLV
ncbi:MAG: GNAT family N-acetyltransferase [Theionarchaea archaeon]|nr:GNAT family N-acetyltransferase [Theionarchaea archaeon]